jgi:hypothetical protein
MSRSLASEHPASEEEFNRLALALFAFQRQSEHSKTPFGTWPRKRARATTAPNKSSGPTGANQSNATSYT